MIVAKLFNHCVDLVGQAQEDDRVPLRQLEVYHVLIALSMDRKDLEYEFYLEL